MKKRYVPVKKVREFVDSQPSGIQAEYIGLVEKLEADGFLVAPYGRKIDSDLFEIRLRRGRQVRIFYFYHRDDQVFGVHGYVKKTQKAPRKELAQAHKVVRMIKRGGFNE